MRSSRKIFTGVFTIASSVALVSGLYAHEGGDSRPKDSPDGRMGMMQMMGNKGTMMEGCRRMMQGMPGGRGAEKPNEQWRQDAPAKPEKNG